MNIGALLGVFPVLGVLTGLARARWPVVPFVVAALIAGAYAAFVATTGILAGQCWDCRSDLGGTRGDGFIASAVFLGLLAITTLAGIWLGARLTTMLQRLLRTWREIRGLRQPPTQKKSDAS